MSERKEKELFKILSAADKQLTPKRFKLAIKDLEPSYGLSSVVKKLKEIPVDEEEKPDENDVDQYPYPYPPKKKKDKYPYPKPDKEEEKPSLPEIRDGKISIEDLISYLEQLSKFKKVAFSYSRCKEILNKNYIAFKKGDGFTPTILCEGSSILMSI